MQFVKDHCGCWVESRFGAGLAWNQTGEVGGSGRNLGNQLWCLDSGDRHGHGQR